MSNFDRWSSCYTRSFAHSRFKEHHTEINELYWSLPPVAGYTEYLARNSPNDTLPAVLFNASGPNARRIAPSMAIWQKHFADFQNWVRLSSLVSALSYLESYIVTISNLAIRSDPLLRFGQSRIIDGTSWLKRGVKDDITNYVVPLVKGKWPTRLSAYRDLFGSIPSQLNDNLSSLENMRVLRNGAAHSFGRDPTAFEDPMAPAGVSARLSESRLQNWLSIIEACACAIDDHLFPIHIGEFELIWRYHRWKYEPRDPLDKNYVESAAFSRFATRTYGPGPTRSFCKDLIAHYDAA